MTPVRNAASSVRYTAWLALGLALSGCAAESEAPVSAKAAPGAESSPVAGATPADAGGTTPAQKSVDELKVLGHQALRENRIHSPAGNNAMEFYVALRGRRTTPHGAVESALMELQPYAVIAAEQAISREDFVEASRLHRLIGTADPLAPALTRIAKAIADGETQQSARVASERLGKASKADEASADSTLAAPFSTPSAKPISTLTAAIAPAPAPARADPGR